jgi:hypothetical protein
MEFAKVQIVEKTQIASKNQANEPKNEVDHPKPDLDWKFSLDLLAQKEIQSELGFCKLQYSN